MSFILEIILILILLSNNDIISLLIIPKFVGGKYNEESGINR